MSLKRIGKVFGAVVGCVALIGFVFNASWRVEPPDGKLRLLAHRGVHQTFDLEGVTNDTCTATRIREPIAPEIENTLSSMRAAFALGADIVELDVHPTTDGQFAVFHDWTLDCRTEGTGPTREHEMAYLKSLDIGYGYTADGGKTFPLRGQGVGLMPSFEEAMTAFPDRQFLINFKSREAREGDMLAEMMAEHPEWRDQVWGVYGGEPPTARAVERITGLRGASVDIMKSCLLGYVAWGWSGYVPDGCRNALIFVPVNIGPWLWGWPDLFAARMQAVGSEIILRGDYGQGVTAGAIDTPADVARVPENFTGIVWTNEIARVAPLLQND